MSQWSCGLQVSRSARGHHREAVISSWYQLLPGKRTHDEVLRGLSWRSFDSLARLTYSRALRAGDYLRHHAAHLEDLGNDSRSNWIAEQGTTTSSGTTMLPSSGRQSQLKSSSPISLTRLNVASMSLICSKSSSTNIRNTSSTTQWSHVYLNNWQSIDFRESMNALLSKKLLGYDSNYELPTVIWQDNTGNKAGFPLDDFGNQTTQRTFSLGMVKRSSKTATRQEIMSIWQGLSDLLNGPLPG